MLFRPKKLISIILGAAFAVPMLIAGCGGRVGVGYRVHDGYYGDDHRWDNGEVGYYNRWESDNHRDHRDFRRRPSREQKEYWEWRHNQH
jgi:hypothetical protein